MATPFELRFEIYREARQRLMDEYYANIDLWKDAKRKYEPDFPTQTQVEEEAKKIYEFVKKQD